MKPKPKALLLATALAAMSVPVIWLVASRDTAPPDPVRRQSGSHRDRQANGQETSRSKIRKPVRELSDDDLLTFCHRKGAAAALAAAKSQPWPDRDNRVAFVLNHLAAENPEFVAAELNSSGLPTFFKGSVVDTILKNWKDGRKVLAWAQNQLTGELHCKAVAGALGILVKSEPEAAFGYFEKLSPGETRRLTIRDLFAAWGSDDPETALLRANEQAPDDLPTATEHVLRGWAKADPAAAAAWVLKTAPTNEKWIAGVYQSWISTSPEQAELWFDSLSEDVAKKKAYILTYSCTSAIVMPVFSTRRVNDTSDSTWASKPVSARSDTDLMYWAAQDTEGARSFVEKNGDSPVSKQLADQVARAISARDGPSAAMDWALNLSNENGNRVQALGTIIYEWSEKDPDSAAGKLAAMPAKQYGKLPISLVNTWVKLDPAAAADWVAGWKGEHQTTLIEDVIDQWPNQDPQAAYQWLGTLPAGAGRDAGIKTMIRRERDSAPDTLQPWVELISDPQLREKTRRKLDE